MTDPFKPKPVTKQLTKDDVYFNKVTPSGHVCKYKMESGVPIQVADLGNIKDFFNHAIMRASLMTPDELATIDVGNMSHVEIAALKMAAYAAAGDMKACEQMFDRVMGKAKQVSESTNLNLTIDDILNGVHAKKEGTTIDV